MTAGAREPLVRSGHASGAEYGDAASRWAAPPGCVITADGAYGARLAHDGERWYPERWTLDGPEPYAVPLPGPQPEEPGTEVLPLSDGRVLIHRVDDGRHTFALLYPTGPGTGELPLGAVECPDAGTVLRLLPPSPDGERAYALAVGRGSTAVWLVAGGAFGPEHLAEVPGHCSGGVWLDGTGRLLALDRSLHGRTKTVVVDLERSGEVSPLLQIAEHSNDRLLLADADSGLLLIRSDAPSPGRDRLGWGVLGSTLPVRFPDCLSATGCSISPFAIQPGQVLTPESCAVALRLDGPGGTWVGVWRPSERRIHHRPAPEGWLPGTGLWTAEGVLRLPYVTGGVPCGVARLDASEEERNTGDPALPGLPAPRPVPLQQAPLRTARPSGPSPQPPAVIGPPRAIPAHLALSDGIARARKDAAARAAEGPLAAGTGAGPVPGGSWASQAGAGPAPEGSWASQTGAGPVPEGSPAAQTGAGPVPEGSPAAQTGAGPVPEGSPASQTGAGPVPEGSPASQTGAGPVPEGSPAAQTGAGPVPEGPETQSTVTSLILRTSPAGVPGAAPHSGHRADGELPPVVPLPGGEAEPLPPAVPRAPEATGPVRPSRWTRVPRPPTPMMSASRPTQSAPTTSAPMPMESIGTSPAPMAPAPQPARRAAPAGTPTTEPGLWTKVAETPPPGMGLRTRADGTLPGGMTVVIETTEPIPPAMPVGAGLGTDTYTTADTDTGTTTGTVAAAKAQAQAPVAPLLWTKVAETPPPGMRFGTRTRSASPDGTAPGNGTPDAPPPVGEFRGQVTLRPLPPAPHTPGDAESGGPCVLAHTDEEKRDGTGEETSPSDSRAMTAR
ncbi:hypothetical protein [Streptomyces sp. NPDC018036]|uniref:hypothetical protein n=1 Tax=Streptomyces sp. NPDC018036 TaxID=3365035 RepID=UPI0037AA478C